METLSDFEMHFYDGTKVIKTSTDKVTLFENNGREVNLLQPMRNESATVAIIAEQFEQCLRHCQMLEAALTNLQATEDCFPVIIGRRPGSVSALNDVSRPNILTPRTPNVCETAARFNINAYSPNAKYRLLSIISDAFISIVN